MKLKTLLMTLLGTTAVLAAPAFADNGRHSGWDRGHGHGYGHWKHHHQYRPYAGLRYAPRPVVVMPPPRVVYTPAPVYYAPAPVYHPAPAYGSIGSGISIRFNLPL